MDNKTTIKRRMLAEVRKQLEIVNKDTAHFIRHCLGKIVEDMECGQLSRAAISNGISAPNENDIRITATKNAVGVNGAPDAVYSLTLFLSGGFVEFGRSCKGEPYQCFAIIELDKFGNRLENAREFLKSAEMYNQESGSLAWMMGRLMCMVVDRVQDAAMGVEKPLTAHA